MPPAATSQPDAVSRRRPSLARLLAEFKEAGFAVSLARVRPDGTYEVGFGAYKDGGDNPWEAV